MQYPSVRDNQNSWSDSQEKLLMKWHTEAHAYNWKHSRAARSYFLRDKWLGIPAIASTAATGTAAFLNLDTRGQCSDNTIILSVVGSVMIVTTIVMALYLYLKLYALAERHNSSAARYKNFSDSVEAELSLPRFERLNGKIFIKQAQKRFDEYLDIYPNIPEWIEKDYRKYINRLSIANSGELNQIIINTSSKNIEDNNCENSDESNKSYIDGQDEDTNDNSKRGLQDDIEKELRRMKIRENLTNMQNSIDMNSINKIINYF